MPTDEAGKNLCEYNHKNKKRAVHGARQGRKYLPGDELHTE